MKWPRQLTVPLWARAIVSIGLIALVLSQLHPGDAVRRLADGEWQWFVLAAGCLLAALAIGAFRWQLFLKAAGIARSLSHAVRVYAIGAFANSFLPTGFGGDALRAWLAGTPGTRAVAAVTVIVDRATMLAMVTAFAWLAYALDPGSVPSVLVQALAAVTVLVVVGGVVSATVLRVGARPGSRLLSRPWVAGSAQSARACFRGPVVWQTALLGLAYEALAVLALWLVARSISLDLSFALLAVVVPAVLVVTALPFSLGGLGLREGSYVVLLHQAGVSTTDARTPLATGHAALRPCNAAGSSCSPEALTRTRSRPRRLDVSARIGLVTRQIALILIALGCLAGTAAAADPPLGAYQEPAPRVVAREPRRRIRQRAPRAARRLAARLEGRFAKGSRDPGRTGQAEEHHQGTSPISSANRGRSSPARQRPR